MPTPDDEVLEFSVAVDIRDSLREIAKFQKQMSKLMKDISRTSDRTSKDQSRKTKQRKKETDGLKTSVDGLAGAYEEEAKQVDALGRTIAELEKRVESLQGTEKAAAQEKLAFLRKEHAERAKAAAETEKKEKKQKDKEPPDYTFSRKNLKRFKKSLKVAGASLKEPLESFLQRDLKGLVENSMKSAGVTLKRSLRLSKFLANASGDALTKRGERASFKGKNTFGVKGAMLEAGGAGMKAMGTMMSKLGGVLGGLAKLGPVLSAASGFLVGLVKAFLDADAAVKEFNNDVLQSAGNLSMFERSGRDADAAGVRLKSTLTDLRNAAFDYETNLRLGITKEEHKAMLSTLNQEGVSLGRIEDEAQLAGKSVRDLATQFTVTGVAYSRAFGVSLAEVGQFQAEMMTELGKSADDAQQAFALMARGAAESGIASNKFFASIRAISPDLSLFNLRLEDSVALLTKISKVMSPQNAQKFMQQAVQGLKTMGRQEKLRLSMFAGTGKTSKIVERDVQRKTEALIASISEKTGEKADALRKAFEKEGYAGIKNSIDKLGPELSGSVAEKAINIEMQRSQASKGQYGAAMATADLGLGGALELQQEALMIFSKGAYKSITEALGSLGLETVAENLGKSDEEVKQFAKLEIAINAQRKALGARGEKMGYDEVIASMTEEMQKSLAVEQDGLSMDEKMQRLAEKQGDLTQSIIGKFEVLLDWLQNQFYNVMLGIWETILDFPFAGNKAERNKVHAIRGAQAGGSAELQGIATKGGDLGKGLAESNVMQSFLKALGGRGGMDGAKAKAVSDLVGEATRDVSPEALANALEMDTGFRFGETIGGRKNRTEFRENVSKFGYEEAAKRAGATSEQAVAGLGKLAYTQGDTRAKFENLGRVEKGLRGQGLLGSGTASSSSPANPASAVAAEATKTNEHLAAVQDDNKKQQTILTQQGIKLAPATVKEEAKGMEGAMLSALRTALFEYYMYSGTDRSVLASSMKAGGVTDPRLMAQYFTGKSLETGGTAAALSGLATGEARKNAAGGMVTGIANGMAVVAAHGEGLASVGRGERIVPAGGGGAPTVQISVSGIGGQDLARMIEGKVVDGIREYKRRERLY